MANHVARSFMFAKVKNDTMPCDLFDIFSAGCITNALLIKGIQFLMNVFSDTEFYDWIYSDGKAQFIGNC